MEIYEHLVLTSSVAEEAITPQELWVKTTVIMTDSVSKNLKIEDGVTDTLKTNYRPYNLLCKSHLVEAFDCSMIEVLSEIEKELQLWERFEMLKLEGSLFYTREKCYYLWNKVNPKPWQVCFFQKSGWSSKGRIKVESSKVYFAVPGKKIHKIRIYCCISSLCDVIFTDAC